MPFKFEKTFLALIRNLVKTMDIITFMEKNMNDDLFLNKQIFYYMAQKYTIDWIFFWDY